MAQPHAAVISAARIDGQAGRAFWRGFVGLLPLWAGAIPSGMAYGLAARSAGLDPATAQLMSLVVFSATAQLSTVTLLGTGVPVVVLVATALALNLQLLLLGLVIGRTLHPRWPQRLAAAWLLTDGAFGVSAGIGPLRLASLLGAGLSMYLGWNFGTGLGSAVGAALPDPRRFGLDLVVPLVFLAVLVPLVRSRVALSVAVAAGLTALLLARLGLGGVAVLGGGLVGCAVGTWSSRPPASGAPGR